MEVMINEAKNVADAFFNLTGSITDYIPFDLKTKELILVGIFTANDGIRGIGTHVRRAIENGATKEEIIGAILLALPVVGISKVNKCLAEANIQIKELIK
jgi:alkylhydroperoxidase/carboxymuconolactone decarboxylase family protein YurZ